MDPLDLDAQLAQLTLMNNRPLQAKNTLQSTDSPDGKNFKKIGPTVPPKPIKKYDSQIKTEVPQSSALIISPISTASYQERGMSSEKASLQKKSVQNSYHPLYGNIKMTLDNPRILEQQLEALEHHKKQLEKKGMLPEQLQQKQNTFNKINSNNPVNHKHNITNYPTKMLQSCNLYSNLTPTGQMRKVPNRPDEDIIYSNIAHPQHISSASNNAGSSSNIVPISPQGNLTYSNIKYVNHSTVGVDDLPPPLPPPPQSSNNFRGDNLSRLAHTSMLPPNCINHQVQEDELPPPPSPVSSSYSELRRATDNFPNIMSSYIENNGPTGGATNRKVPDINMGGFQQMYMNTSYENDYSTYGTSSQASSTYESIYEPINPRPPSELSSRSNYSLYTSYANSGGMTINSGGSDSLISSIGGEESVVNDGRKGASKGKETEVEALTNLLVHSMDTTNDIDSYGICVKCGGRIVGENSGCTAMEEIYHIACFTCSQCQINLQGKPFYALDGKPYCEEDYLNTLEKCSICMKPILERILRATGKPYHPECFCCVICGNSLDGVPFTVDAANKNYCIEDFHKKFAPRCCVCKEPIMPEPGQEETVRVVAIDRSFHFGCYKCEDCGLLLSSEAEGRGCYPLDNHVLCKSCNAERVQALTSRMTTDL